MRDGSGLPASGRALLQLPDGDKEGDKARKRFNYLMLDALKKDRETVVKEGLAAAGRKRKRAADDNDPGSETELQAPGREQLEAVVVWVVIARAGVIDDYYEEEGRTYKWATAMTKHLVKLRQRILQELYLGIKQRIGQKKHIRIIFGACTKPHSDGRVPVEVEHICSNTDLENFLDLIKGAYNLIIL